MRTAACLAVAQLLLSGAAFAVEPASSALVLEQDGAEGAQHSAALEVDAGLLAGYRFTDIDGSREAAEYEYLKDSVLFGGELRLVRFPHRLHLDFDFRNEKDYFGDAWYAFRDILYGREVNSTFFHNLQNIDLDPFDRGAGVDIRDRGETYGLKTSIDHFFVRGTAPEFPIHLYVDGRLVRKSGDRQQRSLLGGAYFNDIVRSTRRRRIDFETTNVAAGISSHLGPVEVDYAHGEKRFEVGGDDVLYDAYGQSGFGPPPGMRPAGVYPHNLIPEVKSSVDRLRIHTSHTGKIVASGTLQRAENKNRYSGAKSEYLIGTGAVTVVPTPKLAFFLKYLHKRRDYDNPGRATITDRRNPANTSSVPVRPSISSTSNEVSGVARFRPVSGLTLKAGYRFLDIGRRDAEDWELPTDSEEHRAHVSARARIAKSIEAKAEYTYRAFNHPAYNTHPDSSHEGRFSLSWVPTPRLSMLLWYDVTKESRDDLHFADTDEPDNRDARTDSVIANITYHPLDVLSVTASYAYTHYEIEQDIEYHDTVGTPHVDGGVSYRDKAHSYALDVQYAPHERIALSAGINHTVGRSSFSPNAPALLAPQPISSFSKARTKATTYTASCQLEMGKGFSSGLRYQHTDFDDDLGNPYDDAEDGKAHLLMLSISKSW
jgi:hypothetical protein